MKKLSDFTMLEVKNLILTISSQLKIIVNDKDIQNVIQAFKDAREKKESNLTYMDIIFVLIESLLITNEQALWVILGAITQSTPKEVQEMNNVEVLKQIADFFTIDIYRKLLSQAIQ